MFSLLSCTTDLYKLTETEAPPQSSYNKLFFLLASNLIRSATGAFFCIMSNFTSANNSYTGEHSRAFSCYKARYWLPEAGETISRAKRAQSSDTNDNGAHSWTSSRYLHRITLKGGEETKNSAFWKTQVGQFEEELWVNLSWSWGKLYPFLAWHTTENAVPLWICE